MPKAGTKEHAFARADYFNGLVKKTTDPVYWEQEKLEAAKAALDAVAGYDVRGAFTTARAMVEAAMHKASFDQHL